MKNLWQVNVANVGIISNMPSFGSEVLTKLGNVNTLLHNMAANIDQHAVYQHRALIWKSCTRGREFVNFRNFVLCYYYLFIVTAKVKIIPTYMECWYPPEETQSTITYLAYKDLTPSEQNQNLLNVNCTIQNKLSTPTKYHHLIQRSHNL